mgnify:FL=1
MWFFQNGALDAAAYPEACQTILQLLWEATQIQDVGRTAVRESALKALCQYEVCGVSEFNVGKLLMHFGKESRLVQWYIALNGKWLESLV